jgi:carboxymethylenebutenolidase
MGMDFRISSATLVVAATLTLAACDTGTTPVGSPAPATTPASTGSPSGAPATRAPAETEEREVVAETLPYAEVEDRLVYGYFVFPADMVDPLPGIILIHERWGLDDGTRGLADRLAGQGYVVLGIDLFDGKVASSSEESRQLILPVVENQEIADENIRQAYDFLENTAQAPRIGAVGWSFGGNWALNAAMLFPDELDAAVIYYGQLTSSEERLGPVNAPILGIFGENDRGVTPDKVDEFQQVLERLGKTYQVEVYPGVGHAFADPTSANYSEAVAEQAWSEVVAFLGQHLSGQAE